jgi:hypothetical protein
MYLMLAEDHSQAKKSDTSAQPVPPPQASHA